MDHSTCWTIVRGAASGRIADREEFARRYSSLVQAYLRKRWRESQLAALIDDASQEIFLELFRTGGALDRFDPERTGSFRGFLYGVIRNVARRFEEREHARERVKPAGSALKAFPKDEAALSRVFDRMWALSVIREAIQLHRERQKNSDESSRRRVKILELRFGDGMPIRDIARKWSLDPARVHKEYARAREEFKAALGEVLSFHSPDSGGSVDSGIRQLREILDG